MRINKYIAHSGICSRRKAEELIAQKKVMINGEVVESLSTVVDAKDIVVVDGKKIEPEKNKIYLMLNKPSGYISAVSDDKGRKTVLDIIKPHYDERIYPVGRLDFDTEGLLILTNDGEFANKLIHPSSNISKTYYVELDQPLTMKSIFNLESGVVIDGYKTKKCRIKKIGKGTSTTKCLITIEEGKNRQVRKMFETQRLRVKYLKRLQIGELYLGDLEKGKFRPLTKKETKYLMRIN